MTSLTISGTTRLARCWELIPSAWTGLPTLRFVAHDRALPIDGETYSPTGGLEPFAAATKEGLGISTGEMRGVLSSDLIRERDLRAGLYRDAIVREFVVDHRFPFAGKSRLTIYRLGEIRWDDSAGAFAAEVIGAVGRLRRNVGKLYSRKCQFNLGGPGCEVALGPFQRVVTVTAVESRAKFTATTAGGEPEDGWFDDGDLLVQLSANDNVGQTLAKTYTNDGEWELHLPLPFDLAIGDEFIATPGCNKLSGVRIDGTDDPDGHCKHKFNNLLNFGGFPFLPTQERVLDTPKVKVQ